MRGIDPPRRFRVGEGGSIELSHVADVGLAPDEQVTFTAGSGSEHDVVRKSWGYYATGSLNRRLPDHGLRPALCAGPDGRTSLLLVERDERDEFDAYLAREGMSVLAWLDREPCPMCQGFALEEWHRYEERPEGETAFDLRGQPYERRLLRCATCGHFVSRTGLDLSSLYEGEYMDTTYAGDGLRRTYDRIMAMPPEASDNVARVARVVAEEGASGTVLDVGSGLGVFPARMKEAGWTVTALDPDARAIEHSRAYVGVDAVQTDFMADPAPQLGRYDLVTLNKVLEHVPDPAAMLARTGDFLVPGGTVYLELPDGEGAAAEGAGREEFFLEHLHVFSMASMCIAAQRAGFMVRRAERLREPCS